MLQSHDFKGFFFISWMEKGKWLAFRWTKYNVPPVLWEIPDGPFAWALGQGKHTHTHSIKLKMLHAHTHKPTIWANNESQMGQNVAITVMIILAHWNYTQTWAERWAEEIKEGTDGHLENKPYPFLPGVSGKTLPSISANLGEEGIWGRAEMAPNNVRIQTAPGWPAAADAVI